MEKKLEIKSILGECPIYGTSWQGKSFFYIYNQYAYTIKCEVTDEEIKEIVNRRHKHTHQSRLMYNQTEDLHVCPDCKTNFKLLNNNE
ncbi:MAG: hypothetical protein J6V35_03620 [Bacteroidales bacterium]|nr:hypothetical protein [Bacteroidales bacterium]